MVQIVCIANIIIEFFVCKPGVCGGSASGKTTVARKIIEELDIQWVTLLSLDSFYKVKFSSYPLEYVRNYLLLMSNIICSRIQLLSVTRSLRALKLCNQQNAGMRNVVGSNLGVGKADLLPVHMDRRQGC